VLSETLSLAQVLTIWQARRQSADELGRLQSELDARAASERELRVRWE
jgi:hypothetical protein